MAEDLTCDCDFAAGFVASLAKSGKSCIPQQYKVESCARYTEGAAYWICSECNPSYRLDSYGKCVRYVQQCASYSSLTGACTGCTNGYELVDGICK